MTVVLSTSGLGKRYGTMWALRDCDLTVGAGRVVALVGPNGAGKTTLLRLVAGLLRPTVGAVAVLDEQAPADSPRALAQMGFVAQEHPLYRRFRVRDLLRMGRALNARWDQTGAEQRLMKLGIPFERRASQLSGGQQAQVALALALAKRPRLLILDEPVASLDPLARREFMQILMATVADDDLTVVLSSHNVAELERVCDHLVLISGGRVQLAGDIDDLLHDHRLLTGPSGAIPNGASVIHVARADRYANVVARTGGTEVIPGWQVHRIGLEELVLAYLRRDQPHRPGAHVNYAVEVPA
jgi:ABC-2 type transport system ATP-binding protein